MRDEASQPGLQLADVLAGLSRYHFENPNAEDAKKWFDRLKKEEKLKAQIIFSHKKNLTEKMRSVEQIVLRLGHTGLCHCQLVMFVY